MARTKDAPLQRQQQRGRARARSSSSSSGSSSESEDRPRARVPFIRRVPSAATTSKPSLSSHTHKQSHAPPPLPRGGVAKSHRPHLAAIVAERSSSREVQRMKPGASKGRPRAAPQSSSSSSSASSSPAPSPPRARSKASAAPPLPSSSSSSSSSSSRILDEDLVKFFTAVDDALATAVGRLRGSDKLRVRAVVCHTHHATEP